MMKVIGGDFRINEKVGVRKGVFHEKIQKIFMPDGFIKLKGYKPEEVRSVEMKNQAGKLVNLEVTFTDGRRALLSGKAKDTEDFLTLQYGLQRQQEEAERIEAIAEAEPVAVPTNEQSAKAVNTKPKKSLIKRLLKGLMWAFLILFVLPIVLILIFADDLPQPETGKAVPVIEEPVEAEKADIETATVPAPKPKPKAVKKSADSKLSSKGVHMTFEACLLNIRKVSTQLGVAPINIVETSEMRMVRFPSSDGFVLVTCSKPDQKMVVTRSTD